jgi:hypothetical protein
MRRRRAMESVLVLAAVLLVAPVVGSARPGFEVDVTRIDRAGVIEAEISVPNPGCVGCGVAGDRVRFELAGIRFPEAPHVVDHLVSVLEALLVDRPTFLEIATVSTDAIPDPWPVYAYLDAEGCMMVNLVLLAQGLVGSNYDSEVVVLGYPDAFLAFDLARLRASLHLTQEGVSNEHISVENDGRIPMDLSGWWVSDASRCWTSAPLPEGTIVQPGGAVTVDVSRSGDPVSDSPSSSSPGMHSLSGCDSPFTLPIGLTRRVSTFRGDIEQIVLEWDGS